MLVQLINPLLLNALKADAQSEVGGTATDKGPIWIPIGIVFIGTRPKIHVEPLPGSINITSWIILPFGSFSNECKGILNAEFFVPGDDSQFIVSDHLR